MVYVTIKALEKGELIWAIVYLTNKRRNKLNKKGERKQKEEEKNKEITTVPWWEIVWRMLE